METGKDGCRPLIATKMTTATSPRVNGTSAADGESKEDRAKEAQSSSTEHKAEATKEPRTSSPFSRVVYVDEPNMWIINDGLLRDEGILFGLSGSKSEEKIAAIDNYFEEKKAPHFHARALAQDKLQTAQIALGELTRQIAQKLDLLASVRQRPAQVSGARIIRYLLGVVLMAAAAYGSFYMVDYYITPVYGLTATIGVFLFGLFAQMAPVSGWLQSPGDEAKEDATSKVRELLLELGPAFSATVLTAYLIYRQTDDGGLAFILGFFLLFLFFFNGKLVLALTNQLVSEVKERLKLRAERREWKRTVKQVEKDLSEAIEKEKGLRTHITEHERQALDANILLEEFEKQRLNKVSLFLSEYNLASHFSKTHNQESV